MADRQRERQEEKLKDITVQFCRLNVVALESTLEWLYKNFSKCDLRDSLIVYLSREDIVLKEKFYHKEKDRVIFYFRVYNSKNKRSYNKHISLGIPKSSVTSPGAKQRLFTLAWR